LSIGTAIDTLKHLPYEELDFAKVDHHRSLRGVIPEVIFAQNKKTDAVVAIARAMLKKSGRFLITRAREDMHAALGMKEAKFYPASGIIACGKPLHKKGLVLIVCAGTSDIPVAEEAEITASFLGSRTEKIIDVGVAGIHRLLSFRDRITKARVIIVVAGMEGALPSVVGGLTDKPVIAVPTSVGYGTSLGGLTALFAMLNSCVPGIAVVNIDNGFGAGCLAHKINIIKT
ncbi:MAG: nickel pincer cofactor biosynthesis protein LarB, partial [Nitrospirae bacterium]|nr:nickel pincer cofactor biosynthesis protein LarB [Nitrospirota bacterium]